MDVGRWSAAADRVDRSLLEGADGPVIDIGCGPGRMLVAARALGIPSLGVDVSGEAVATPAPWSSNTNRSIPMASPTAGVALPPSCSTRPS